MNEIPGPSPRRILIIGASGSGKSTAAAAVAEKLGLPFIATDSFYWLSDWRPAAQVEYGRLADEATSQPRWVMDGNFDDLRAIVWARAELIVWLDFPTALVIRRVILRNTRWLISRTPTWSGNRMDLARAISGIRHACRSIAGKRRNYPAYLSEFPSKPALRFTNPRDLAKWIDGLASRADASIGYNRP